MGEDEMGELRSALHEPGPERWARICELLEGWGDDDALHQQALPYAHHHLQSWPEREQRPLPERWHPALAGRQEDRDLARRQLELSCLANRVDCSRYSSEAPLGPLAVDGPPAQRKGWRRLDLTLFDMPQGLWRWLAQSEIPALDWVRLGRWNRSQPFDDWEREELQALGAARWWEQVRFLNLGAMDGNRIQAMVPRLRLPSLTSLQLAGSEGDIDAEAVKALLDAATPGTLVSLDFSSCWFDHDVGEVLGAHPVMAHVEEIDLRYNAGIDREPIFRSSVVSQAVRDQIDSYYEDVFE